MQSNGNSSSGQLHFGINIFGTVDLQSAHVVDVVTMLGDVVRSCAGGKRDPRLQNAETWGSSYPAILGIPALSLTRSA